MAVGALAAPAGAEDAPKTAELKVLIAGAHPDDPESGCGGTISRYVQRGHEAAILYLTRGEGGIRLPDVSEICIESQKKICVRIQ
jgi:N-acetylglucosamine malate deacetylase 1